MKLNELHLVIKKQLRNVGWVEVGLLRWADKYQCPVYAKEGRNVVYLDLPRLQGEVLSYTATTCGKAGLTGHNAEDFIDVVASYLQAQQPKGLSLVMVACCPLDFPGNVLSHLNDLDVTCSLYKHPDRIFVENSPGGSREMLSLASSVTQIIKSFDKGQEIMM